MRNIDELINETLSAEDEALLARYGTEPGYVRQAFWLFRGKLGWVMCLVAVVQVMLFLGAIYAFWATVTATDLLIALRWGVGTVVLVQMSALLRSFMGMHFEANRVLRELARLELRIVRGQQGE
ncbi:MAG TPA: DUF6768 family protein [Woeseiaceae bacterium]|jgi:hypothetical protein|nr:DUF6768 family protein [Woeseiaceae bacterium]